jgi:hypothetical protein
LFRIAIAARGVELFLPRLNATYQEISETSFADAEVSGTIALLIQRNSGLNHDDARRILMSTARDLGPLASIRISARAWSMPVGRCCRVRRRW